MADCSRCGSPSHTAFTCFRKQRTPIGKKKHIRKIGKVGRQWIATRKEWIAKNLPKYGYWNCTYCGKQLDLGSLTLDHKLSRSRHPELRYELSNLTPACWECNSEKGSKDYDEI